MLLGQSNVCSPHAYADEELKLAILAQRLGRRVNFGHDKAERGHDAPQPLLYTIVLPVMQQIVKRHHCFFYTYKHVNTQHATNELHTK